MTEPKTLYHYPRCFGCGESNARGLSLEVTWNGNNATSTHLPPADAEGGPGVVHGGYVGALVDEMLGLVATEAGDLPAMTRRLEIDYRSPTFIERPLEMTAWVEEVGERRVIVQMTATHTDSEQVSFEAKGVYVRVPIEAWSGHSDRSRIDFSRGDFSNFFKWQQEAMKKVFVPSRITKDLVIVIEITDIEPRVWTFLGSASGLAIDEGEKSPFHARVRCAYEAWQGLRLNLDRLVSNGDVEIEGDRSAVEELMGSLDF